MSRATSRIADLIADPAPAYSFEFFPPKDAEGEAVLWRSIHELEPLQPTFVSVTYGAGGTTRDRTIALTRRIAQETTLRPVAHLTCVGHTVEELEKILGQLRESGVSTLLALRGDPPAGPGTAWVPTPGGLDYAADLVRLARAYGEFDVGVAAFPEGHRDVVSLEDDTEVLRLKHRAGASFAVTEMVLRASDYTALVARARAVGVDFPIVPGIMPILNYRSMAKMVEFSGREFPAEVRARVEPLREDPAALRAEGIQIAIELCEELLAAGAPGLHFYTLNRSTATRQIFAAITGRG